MTSGAMNFARRLIYLKRDQLIDFEQRPYLSAMYGSSARNIVVRAARQVEKSTYLAAMILYLAATHAGIQILYVCPRREQAQLFARTRVITAIADSPILCHCLADDKPGRLAVTNMLFANGSNLFVRAAYHSADAVRGISADVLMCDEFQDLAAGDLPVLQESLSHSEIRRSFVTGTPKLIDNHLESMFRKSTANEWLIGCNTCGRDVRLDERAIGPEGLICPECQSSIDKLSGRWVAGNPTATWGDGFWLPGPAVYWKEHEQILQCQDTYDYARFRNEVLGLPVSLGSHIVTREQLEQCCGATPMAKSIDDIPYNFRDNIVAGVDWGGGAVSRTAVVIGFARPEGKLEICHFACIPAREDPEQVRKQVTDLCRRFQVRWIAADGGGNGSIYNRLLLAGIDFGATVYGLLYGTTDSEPYQDGILWKWRIGRTASIGYLISCIQKGKIIFPTLDDSAPFLDEFACEVAEYDDKSRCVKYTHPETQPDDILHACNYAVQIMSRGFARLAPRDSE